MGVYVYRQTRPKEVRGSSTVQFVVKAPPVHHRPKKVVIEQPWPMYGLDPQRTHVAADFKLRPPYRRLWTVRMGNSVEFPPVVGYGAVYVNQRYGRFFKIDGKTGKILWRKHFHNCSAASPTVGDKVVYVALMQPYPCARYPRTQSGMIVALRVRSGKQLWRYTAVGAVESSPLLVKGVLYFGSWDHHLYALDVRGRRPRLLWRFEADSELNTSAAYTGGTVYIASDGGGLYAVNAKTGRLRWRATSFSHFPRGREYFYATPTVAYGRIFIGNTDGTMFAFGATSGNLLWAQHAGTYVYTAAAVWRRTVYVGTYDGKLEAFNAATGDLRWAFDAASSIHGAPTIMAGVIYFSTCGTCGSHGSRYAKLGRRLTYALDARNGKLLWTFPDGQYSPVVADRERVYLAGQSRIYGLAPVKRP